MTKTIYRRKNLLVPQGLESIIVGMAWQQRRKLTGMFPISTISTKQREQIGSGTVFKPPKQASRVMLPQISVKPRKQHHQLGATCSN
ncbi:rCG52481, partial [Rattus norvegicus]